MPGQFAPNDCGARGRPLQFGYGGHRQVTISLEAAPIFGQCTRA
jgi:hypothetical protein